MSERFFYLLNAMEGAARTENPYEHDYAGKRRAVIDYVEKLESSTQSAEGRSLTITPSVGGAQGASDANAPTWPRYDPFCWKCGAAAKRVRATADSGPQSATLRREDVLDEVIARLTKIQRMEVRGSERHALCEYMVRAVQAMNATDSRSALKFCGEWPDCPCFNKTRCVL